MLKRHNIENNYNIISILVKKLKNGASFGFSLTSVDLGDISRTTTFQPEGTGNTFSPSIFSLNIGYAKSWEEKLNSLESEEVCIG